MNNNFFKNQMVGNWIVQSTNYFPKKESILVKILNNEVKFIKFKKEHFYRQILSLNLDINFAQDKIELYSIQSKDKKNKIKTQYLLIIYKNKKEAFILKFNSNFKFINKFILKYDSQKYFSIFSKISNIIILEKIYCLNNNLKLIKTIIKKDNKFASISFASEIRIS